MGVLAFFFLAIIFIKEIQSDLDLTILNLIINIGLKIFSWETEPIC